MSKGSDIVKKSIQITYENTTSSYNSPIKVKEILKDNNQEFIVAKVNNRLRELNYLVNEDAIIEGVSLNNSEAVHIYETTLRYMIALAFKEIYPQYQIRFKYSVSRTIFCYVLNDEHEPMELIMKNIQKKLEQLIEENHEFKRLTLTKEEAMDYYRSNQMDDKIDILAYRPEPTLHFYECDGYLNYMNGYMAASTGYISEFKLIPYEIGFLIQYPRAESKGQIPAFKDSKPYIETLRKASTWAEIVQASHTSEVNDHVKDGRAVQFIHMCETNHNAMLTDLGNIIYDNQERIKLVAIAGPSSSGKTTFANRLKIELLTHGLNPISISLDNYYLSHEHVPLDENGVIDLEHIEALDIKLFNQNMHDLIHGKEAMCPVFDFTTKQRSHYKKLKIKEDDIIIIEGIHALNERLTHTIPRMQKYKVFISPQIQMNLDHHNPLSITNLRLIRRIVRDYQYRSSSAERTISMWNSVRQGEFKWIYPHQDDADYTFNSGLQYELCSLKKYALPVLNQVPEDNEHFIAANRLKKFLKYFVDIDDSLIPCNSLLREFIGDSCFRE
jgi:uridine kinase